MTDIAAAIYHKWPRAEVSVAQPQGGTAEVTWLDHSPISEKSQSEIDLAVTEYDTYLAATKYRRDRIDAYASRGDQLDNITKALKVLKAAGTDIGSDGDAQIAMSDAVKAAYPKP
jgi:hypothetical protein